MKKQNQKLFAQQVSFATKFYKKSLNITMYKIMIRSIFSSNKLNQITSETYESKQTFE